jgi:hypothetical protein
VFLASAIRDGFRWLEERPHLGTSASLSASAIWIAVEKWFALSLFTHSLRNSIDSLHFFVGLQDDHYKEMTLNYEVQDDNGDEPPICPLTNLLWKKFLLQNKIPMNSFGNFTFRPINTAV